MRFRSTNPVLGKLSRMYPEYAGTQATYKGVAGKTIYYMVMVSIGALAGIFLFLDQQLSFLATMIGISGIVGFISSLIAFMNPRASKIAGTIYCLFEGVIVGVISLIFEMYVVKGVVPIAILGTIAVVLVAATLFLTGIVKVTSKFTKFLLIFTISILFTYFLVFILSLFGNNAFSTFLSDPKMGIIVSLIMVFLATLYIIFDLENIRQVVEGGQPKEMEWFAAFGLAFTIIWLYMEILPLVAQILLSDR